MLKTKEFPGWILHVTKSHRMGLGCLDDIAHQFLLCLSYTDTLDTLTQHPRIPLPQKPSLQRIWVRTTL